MEKLRALREKHAVPGTEKLIDFTYARVHNLKNNAQHLSELSGKFEEQKSNVASLEESLNAEEHNLFLKNQEWMIARNNLKELQTDRDRLLLEVHQLESRRNNLKNLKPSTRDQELLELGKKKLDCYKQLTGIRWDYGAPEGTVKGYVTNGKGYLHRFNYQKTEQNASELEEELWKEVAKQTARSEIVESIGDENCAPNN